MLSPDELMKPRFKVIGDYPCSPYKIGNIINFKTAKAEPILELTESIIYSPMSAFDKYPHLFKPLEWWEERDENEMPEYVKSIEEKNSITIINNETELNMHKVKKHFAMNLSGDFRYSSYSCFVSEWNNYCYSYGSFLPATLEEFQSQSK